MARPVYSEEVVWHPKTSEDPQYQFDGIVAAFKTAACKLPRVDGIGVSSAGVFIGNAPMVSSIFIKVPRSRREEVKTIYDRAAKETRRRAHCRCKRRRRVRAGRLR